MFQLIESVFNNQKKHQNDVIKKIKKVRLKNGS